MPLLRIGNGLLMMSVTEASTISAFAEFFFIYLPFGIECAFSQINAIRVR